MYTRKKFGLELKYKLENSHSLFEIGDWASKVYYENCRSSCIDDDDFDQLLTILGHMSNGEEFHFEIKFLHDLASDLVNEKKINLEKILLVINEL